MTAAQLEMEFKRFGPIKQGGVQVRNNKVSLKDINFPGHCLRSSTQFLHLLCFCLGSNKATVLALLNFSRSAPWIVQFRCVHLFIDPSYSLLIS